MTFPLQSSSILFGIKEQSGRTNHFLQCCGHALVSGSSILGQCGSGPLPNTDPDPGVLFICGSFLPSCIQIRIPKADPDPADQNQSGSISTTIIFCYLFIKAVFRNPHVFGSPESGSRGMDPDPAPDPAPDPSIRKQN